MPITTSSSYGRPASEPSQSWEPHDDPCLPTDGDTRELWEFTSLEGWTHLVYIEYNNVNIAKTPPYSIGWTTPDYTHHEYQTPTGNIRFGPHITPYQTELRAMTYEGARNLARSFRDEIISMPGTPHENIERLVKNVDSQNDGRTTLADYFNDWEAAINDREEWRATRSEIHAQARDEYAELLASRRKLLADLEASEDSFVPIPGITEKEAYNALVDSYVAGDIWLLEFEDELEKLLE